MLIITAAQEAAKSEHWWDSFAALGAVIGGVITGFFGVYSKWFDRSPRAQLREDLVLYKDLPEDWDVREKLQRNLERRIALLLDLDAVNKSALNQDWRKRRKRSEIIFLTMAFLVLTFLFFNQVRAYPLHGATQWVLALAAFWGPMTFVFLLVTVGARVRNRWRKR